MTAPAALSRLTTALRAARHPVMGEKGSGPAWRGDINVSSSSGIIFGRTYLSPQQRDAWTPAWDYIAPILGFLDSHGDEMVLVHVLKNHLGGEMKHTAADTKYTGSGVSWRRDVDRVKETLRAAALVEDNGSKGAAAQWRITPQGSALLKLLLAGDVNAEEWWHLNGPNAKQ